MIVTCENCDAKFNLDEDLIKESGSKVKCSKCDHAFTVYKPVPAEEPEPALEHEEETLPQPEAEEVPEEPVEEEAPEAAEEALEETLDLEIEEAEEETLPQPEAEEVPEEAEEKPAEEIAEEEPGEEKALEEVTLEEEPGKEEAPEAAEEALEETLDLEIEEAEEEEPVLEEAEEETVTVEEEPGKEEAPEAEAQEEPTEELSDAVSADPVEEAGEEETKQVEEKPPPPPVSEEEPPTRKRISTPIMIVLVFAVLAGGAFAAYSLLKSFDIKIPFLEFLTGAPEPVTIESGNLRITLLDQLIKGEFVENSTYGHLFVIKGKVRNDYSEARSFIMIKGVLYSKSGEAVQHKTVYCGNTLSETDLQALDKATIETKLRNKFGDERSNFRVPSGKVLPFVIVFSGLPQDLGEFSVEVASSVPG